MKLDENVGDTRWNLLSKSRKIGVRAYSTVNDQNVAKYVCHDKAWQDEVRCIAG